MSNNTHNTCKIRFRWVGLFFKQVPYHLLINTINSTLELEGIASNLMKFYMIKFVLEMNK